MTAQLWNSTTEDVLIKNSIISHSIFIIQCLLGILLNAGILVVFFVMKQIRGSVYASYMIQIAITDVLVCITWLVFSSINIYHVQQISDKFQKINEGNHTIDSSFDMKLMNSVLTIYNFHFYINIFLLAAMSVERFVAVWKSIRCQRYQFNKKLTYVISGLMWVVAFCCVLPSIIDGKLGFGDENEIGSKNYSIFNEFLEKKGSQWKHWNNCHDLFKEARDYKIANPNAIVVIETVPNSSVSAVGCTNFMCDIPYSYYSPKKFFSCKLMLKMKNNSLENKRVPNIKYSEYKSLLYHYGDWLRENTPNEENSETCAPHYEKETKIYKIAVDAVIGFFLPYIAIVFSYLGIAYMISKRAKSRLNTDKILINTNISTARPSEQKVSPFSSKETAQSTNARFKKSSKVTKLKLSPINRIADRKRRPVSNGSASSAESFFTDQTCVQVSPGIKLSPPNFNYSGKSKEAVTKIEERNPNKVHLGYLSGKTAAYKNAERQIKIAKTVTAYVIVFSICWLPQKIFMIVYIMQGLKEKDINYCHAVVTAVRIISFFSVLLNPIVYATTQRDINKYIRKHVVSKLYKCFQFSNFSAKYRKSTAGSKFTNDANDKSPKIDTTVVSPLLLSERANKTAGETNQIESLSPINEESAST